MSNNINNNHTQHEEEEDYCTTLESGTILIAPQSQPQNSQQQPSPPIMQQQQSRPTPMMQNNKPVFLPQQRSTVQLSIDSIQESPMKNARQARVISASTTAKASNQQQQQQPPHHHQQASPINQQQQQQHYTNQQQQHQQQQQQNNAMNNNRRTSLPGPTAPASPIHNNGSDESMIGKRGKNRVTFPKARIKKIMQQDEEVGKIAAPVPILLSRCLELFISDLVKGTLEITKSSKGTKTMSAAHLKQCVDSNEKFDFLKSKIAASKISASDSPSSPGGAEEEEDEDSITVPKSAKKRRNSKASSSTGEPPKKRGRKKKSEEVAASASSEESNFASASSVNSANAIMSAMGMPSGGARGVARKLPLPVGGMPSPSYSNFSPSMLPSAQQPLGSPPPGLRSPGALPIPPQNQRPVGLPTLPPLPHGAGTTPHVPTPLPSFPMNTKNAFPVPPPHHPQQQQPMMPHGHQQLPSLRHMLSSDPPSSEQPPSK